MVKFEDMVHKSAFLTAKEKQRIISYGKKFTEWKNKCSTSVERRLILESGPVLMGKILYSNSDRMRDEFWNKIFCRRNQIISDREEYRQTLIEDIEAIPMNDIVDVDSLLG
mmetsp:Transcript_23291/g.20665  ORF Transcript_23291/g.20665 Transcript_23291/m.20665 type:complete len:111 (-) Transcript_23291:57-389(-)